MTSSLRASRLLRPSLAILACWLASGCAVGPDFHRPAPPTATAYAPPGEAIAPASPGLAEGADVAADWWTAFHSPALNATVEEALRANPDLQAARAALRQAQETYLAQRGALLPTVGVDYNATRQKASNALSPPLNSNLNPFTLHTAQLNIAYAADLFGGVRRQVEQAKAQAEQQKFQTEAAYISLTTNVVSAVVQEASLRDQVGATRAIIDADRQVLAAMRRQFQVGQIARADVAAQETALAQAELALPPLEKQLAQTRDLIADLTGHAPADPRAAAVELSTLNLPDPMPVSLPARLVDQRPDVRAAEANLHAASAGVGVAIAARLPAINLTASAGGAATQVSDLFRNGNGFWSLGADVAQPIFQGGALYHRQKGAEAALDQAKAQYRSAVLGAMQNVADTLQALQADDRALSAAMVADKAAAESLAIARRQLELGQVAGIVVLNAEQASQTAKIARIQAQAARLTDAAALFQALGGGWWNRRVVS